MTYTEWLNFEIMVMDIAEREKINNATDLEEFADELHTHIEVALQDYADDNGFRDDYVPSY